MVKNVLDFDEFVREISLEEGLIMSHSADKIVRYLHNKYNLTDNEVENYYDGTDYILVNKNLDTDLFDKINQVMVFGGYYKSDKDDNDKYFTYEKKFEKEVFGELKQSGEIKYLYHLSPSINDKKIQTIGLIPKSKNYRFNYPDRIYLLSDKDVDNKPWFVEQMCIELVKPILTFGKKSEIDRIKTYSVYRIDFNKLDDIKLYIDYNASGFDSYYTMDNIRPEFIEKINEIEI